MHYALAAIVASQVSTLNNFILILAVGLQGTARRAATSSVRYLTFNALNVATLVVRVPLLALITNSVTCAPCVEM